MVLFNSRFGFRWAGFMLAAGLAACAPMPSPTPGAAPDANAPSDKVAVLVTGWGTPRQYSSDYYSKVLARSQVGDRTQSAGDPCTQYHIGTPPFGSHVGLRPYALGHNLEGFERVWDSSGIYERSRDGSRYVNVIDRSLVLTTEDIGDATVTAMKDARPAAGSGYGPDPRTGIDHLSDVYKIDIANGIPDFDEGTYAYWKRIRGWFDFEDRNILAPVNKAEAEFVDRYFEDFFGDAVTVAHGYYEALPGVTMRHDDKAVQLAEKGYRKMLIARETTDNNNYANNFMSLYYPYEALCRAGYAEAMEIKQVRQVGRTPEYNHMLMVHLEPYLAAFPRDEEISILYTTYGLPWPGGNPEPGPLAILQPWAKEVYFENAYNNFLSFKRRMESTYGGDYRLNFNKSGGFGGPDARTNSLYAFGLDNYGGFGDVRDELRYTTVRDNLEQAIRVDGRAHVLIVLSHWDQNSADTYLRIPVTNDLPIPSNRDMRRGNYATRWCERYLGPGDYEQELLGKDESCADGWTTISYMEAFDDVIDLFNMGYANRLRGGVERFGIFPDLGIAVAAEGPITKLGGGQVTVAAGALAGAAVFVRPDPQPDAPDGYEWKDTYRYPSAFDRQGNLSADAIRPFNAFLRPEDHLESGWDDYTAYIGTQRDWRPGEALPVPDQAASEVVYVGPYRTLLNAPATITLPYDTDLVDDPKRLRPRIFNDITGDFEPVEPVPGGAPPRVDSEAGTVSFDVQTFGLFVLTEDGAVAAGTMAMRPGAYSSAPSGAASVAGSAGAPASASSVD